MQQGRAPRACLVKVRAKQARGALQMLTRMRKGKLLKLLLSSGGLVEGVLTENCGLCLFGPLQRS